MSMVKHSQADILLPSLQEKKTLLPSWIDLSYDNEESKLLAPNN